MTDPRPAGSGVRPFPGEPLARWWESSFGWDHLLAAGVLVPLGHGLDVAYRPPAWDRRSRPGAIEVPASALLVVVEGVGSTRRGLTTLLDVTVWVQADHDEATRRGIARDGGTPQAGAFWREWAAEEGRFLAADRPWERATATLCGTPGLLDPRTVLGDPAAPDSVSTAVRALPEGLSIAGGACRS